MCVPSTSQVVYILFVSISTTTFSPRFVFRYKRLRLNYRQSSYFYEAIAGKNAGCIVAPCFVSFTRRSWDKKPSRALPQSPRCPPAAAGALVPASMPRDRTNIPPNKQNSKPKTVQLLKTVPRRARRRVAGVRACLPALWCPPASTTANIARTFVMPPSHTNRCCSLHVIRVTCRSGATRKRLVDHIHKGEASFSSEPHDARR